MKLKRILSLCLSAIMTVSVVNVAFADTVKTEDTTRSAVSEKMDDVASNSAVTVENKVEDVANNLSSNTEKSVFPDKSEVMENEKRQVGVEVENKSSKSSTDVAYPVAYPVEGGYIYFNKTTGAITDATAYVTSVNIPEYIQNIKVTEIGDYAFDDCRGLKNIKIPNTVTKIGECAFRYCLSLESIEIPDSIEYIGSGAFINCDSLKSVKLSENIKSIEEGLFLRCYDLTEVNIPNGVTDIKKQAFAACIELKDIYIPENVTTIGVWSFSGCSNLKNVIISDRVESIENDAFHNCDNIEKIKTGQVGLNYGWENRDKLKTVELTDNVTDIKDESFYGCENLESVAIGNNVKNIGAEAFCGCKGLTNIEIPEKVTSIGRGAFLGCNSLTKITIPNSVTSIGDSVFSGCSNLTDIIISNNILSIGDSVFYSCSSLKNITIPEKVTSIGNGAFSYCSSLGKIIIPESVTSIGDSAFSYCSNLDTITIPKSVISVGTNAFRGCIGLVEVILSDNIDSIGTDAFYNCNNIEKIKTGQVGLNYGWNNRDKLKTVELTDSVLEIKKSSFYSCKNLKSVTMSDSVISIGNSAFYGCSSLDDIIIPKSVITIGDSAFYNCSSLTNITIPEKVTSIGNSAFSNCSGLIEVILPDNMESIGTDAFYNCNNIEKIKTGQVGLNYGWENRDKLKTVELTDNVLEIKNSSFYGCKNLKSVTMPKSVITIGDSAFCNCSSLNDIIIPESVMTIGDSAFYNCSSLTGIEIPNSVTNIGENAFSGCSGLIEIILPDNIENIGAKAFYNCNNIEKIKTGQVGLNYGWKNRDKLKTVELTDNVSEIKSSSFYGCKNLKSVTMPNSVISIGSSAFEECSSLTSIEIPNSVTSIGNYAFKNCSSLTSITIPSSVTNIGNDAFSGCENLTIHCQPGSYAETYAKKYNIKYVTDSSTGEDITEDDVPADVGDSIRFSSKVYECGELMAGKPPYNLDLTCLTKDESMLDKITFTCSDNSIIDIGQVKTKGYYINLTDDYSYKVTHDVSLFKNGNVIITATLPNGDSSSCLVKVECYKDGYDFNNDFTKPDLSTKITADTSLTYENGSFNKDSIPLTISYGNNRRIDHQYTEEETDKCTVKNMKIDITLPAGLSFSKDNISDKTRTIDVGNVELGTGDELNYTVYPTSYVANSMTINVSFKGDNVDVTNNKIVVVSSNENINYDLPSSTVEYLDALSEEDKLAYLKNDYEEAVAECDKKIAERLTVLKNQSKVNQGSIYDNIKSVVEANMITAKDYSLNNEEQEAITRALYKFISEGTDNLIALGKINAKDNNVNIGASMVNKIRKAINNETVEEDVEFNNAKYKVKFNVTGIWGAFNCDGFEIINRKTGAEKFSATIANTTNDKVAKVMEDYVKQLQSIGVDANNQAIELLLDDFSDNLGIQKYIKGKFLDKLKDNAFLNNRGLNGIYNYSKTISDDLKALKGGNASAIYKVLNTDFDYTSSISDSIINKAYSNLRKTRNVLVEAYVAKLAGQDYSIGEKLINALFSIDIMCPVDIMVYDANGNQIGSVIDGVVEDNSDIVDISTVGESKKIKVLKDEKISFKVIATDSGKLNVSIQNYNNEGSPVSRENYYNIPITIGKTFTTDSLSANTEDVKIYSDDTVYTCDEKLYAKNSETMNVVVECENGSVLGNSKYVKGDYVSLIAVPDDGYEFMGWYKGDEFLSYSYVYNFTAKEDVSIKAMFNKVEEDVDPTPEPTVYISGDADNSGKLEANDAALVLQKVLTGERVELENVSTNAFELLDTDKDGKLTARDSAYILQKVLDSTFIMPNDYSPKKAKKC